MLYVANRITPVPCIAARVVPSPLRFLSLRFFLPPLRFSREPHGPPGASRRHTGVQEPKGSGMPRCRTPVLGHVEGLPREARPGVEGLPADCRCEHLHGPVGLGVHTGFHRLGAKVLVAAAGGVATGLAAVSCVPPHPTHAAAAAVELDMTSSSPSCSQDACARRARSRRTLLSMSTSGDASGSPSSGWGSQLLASQCGQRRAIYLLRGHSAHTAPDLSALSDAAGLYCDVA
jgi:hypothetical protein